MIETEPTTSAPATAVVGPDADAFPRWPLGWSVLADSRDIDRRPVSAARFGQSLVCYRAADGSAVAMDGRCWHMGADLSGGQVIGDKIQCPFHGWCFGSTGRCEHIPASSEIPAGARQRVYATAERAGKIFVMPDHRVQFPLPFFQDLEPAELLPSPSFEFKLNCPWWLVSANAFDLQHFAAAHDRRLIEPPTVHSPDPAARRITARFEVCGKSWRDRLTRRCAGAFVTMDVTAWAGTLVFVTARFHDRPEPDGEARSTSYGMTEIRPIEDAAGPRSLVCITIFRQRRARRLALDWLDVRVRRHFIRAFLKPDARLLDGARYLPHRLIAADRTLSDYLHWLARLSHGQTQEESS